MRPGKEAGEERLILFGKLEIFDDSFTLVCVSVCRDYRILK